MASFNKVTLMGNLTRDPELRHTQSGIAVANFGLAVNNPRSSQDDAVDFFDVTAWRGIGETVANYKQKGEAVLIEGRLEQQHYEDKQGNARSKHVVIAENIQFLPSGNGGNGGSNGGSNGSGQGSQEAQESQTAGVGANGANGAMSDEDIPF
jgi:single-strand DNA-binding protein